MAPALLHWAGGLADAASTYYFLTRGPNAEDNAFLAPAGNRPAATALSVLAGLAAAQGAHRLLRRVWPGAADAALANLGAQQLAIAVANSDDKRAISSFGEYQQAMLMHQTKGR